MSRATAIVRYDGVALSDHAMDVADLAPALLGLSDLVKAANKQANGDRTHVKVLVSVDTEHKCFEFSIEIVQTIMQHLAMLVGNDRAATAKDIAEWVGIIGGSSFGLFKAYKWMARRNVTLTELEIEGQGEEVKISDVHNSNITVNNNTYNLMLKPDVIEKVKNVVRPLTREGYSKLQFEEDGAIADELSSDDGRDICAIPESLEVHQRINKTILEAKVKVRSPDLLGNSQWSVIHDKAIRAKVEDERWLEQFQNAEIELLPGSFLHVKLRMEIMLDSNNDPIDEPKYFIVEVLSVIAPDQQGDLFAD